MKTDERLVIASQAPEETLGHPCVVAVVPKLACTLTLQRIFFVFNYEARQSSHFLLFAETTFPLPRLGAAVAVGVLVVRLILAVGVFISPR